ncbi:MAG: indole-3-glycerol phosphate synthase TrpC [Nitrospiraceae bacterium]|nr:indole-3-glycerol phosphate synthase TrpC [Nitrospiraceae bacterium]
MILDKICAYKRREVDERKAETPQSELLEAIEQVREPRPFRDSLRREGIGLIAEIKRRSPSKGVLIADADPVQLAALYEAAGASAISVLTDGPSFGGSLDDLSTVHQNVKLPCLRKEFIIDEYQIYEARAHSADAVLLIVRILDDTQLREYRDLAVSLGMAPLVETHSAEEIERALEAGAHIIGINNRNLTTFEVDIKTTLELKRLVPGGNVLVSESGIHTRDHVRMLEDGGVDAILVGEALVTSRDIRATIHELLGCDES